MKKLGLILLMTLMVSIPTVIMAAPPERPGLPQRCSSIFQQMKDLSPGDKKWDKLLQRGNSLGCALYVFVSKPASVPGTGGLTWADEICQSQADAAGLPGTYLAWLSDATHSPSIRFFRSPFPYRLVVALDIVAVNFSDLTDGSLDGPINRYADGIDILFSNVALTGTQFDGTSSADHCDSWTNTSAGSHATTGTVGSLSDWTDSGMASCNFSNQFYCFQQE